jgi:PTH1 family peptidyl-tRNA hydrolase
LSLLSFLKGLLRRGSTEPLTGLDPSHTRLLVGLGNPGPEFADTRHNIGFRVLDVLAKGHNVAWQDKSDSLSAYLAVIHPEEELNVVLAKPQTFMNRSGTAVRDVLAFLKLEPAQALIIYDEMDLPLGAIRLRERGSPGTHNGMKSVVSSLGTSSIPRLRLGIGQSSPGEATSHVLSEFAEEDHVEIEALLSRAVEAALTWAEHGAATAMNRYNNT